MHSLTSRRSRARISLTTLLPRMPGIELDESREIEWYRNAANLGPITLPLVSWLNISGLSTGELVWLDYPEGDDSENFAAVMAET